MQIRLAHVMPQTDKHCRSDLLMLCHRQTLQIRLAHVMPQEAKHCRSDLLMLCHKHCRSDLLMLCHKQTLQIRLVHVMPQRVKHCRSDLLMLCHKQTNIADQTCSCYATNRQTLQIRLAHVMPQTDKHCRSVLLPHPLTINCHQARLPYSGQPLLCQCLTDVTQPVRKRHTAHTCGKCSDHLTIKEAIGSYRLTQVSICVYSVACMMFFVLLVQRQLSTGIPW